MSGKPFSERVPPHDMEAEQSALCCCLIDPETIPVVLGKIGPEDCYADKHGTIVAAIRDVHGRGDPVDLITVEAELKRTGKLEHVGGLPYLISLTNATATPSNAGAYAEIVANTAASRRLITAARRIVDLGYGDMPWDEFRSSAVSVLHEAAFSRESGGVQHLGRDLYEFAEKAYDDWKAGKANEAIVWTGFTHQDNVMPLVKGETTIVAAASSVGKTTYKNALEANVARRKQYVLAFSLEMSKRQIMQKAWSRAARINSLAIRKLGLSEAQWERSFEALAKQTELPLYYVSRSRMRYADMKLAAMAFKAKYGRLDLITIDYWQIIGDSPRKDERNDRMLGRLVEDTKALAVELDCHVIIIAQAKIDSTKPIPSLEDVKESRDIVAAADNVLFLTRPMKCDPELSIVVPTTTGGAARIKCGAIGGNGRPIFENVMIGVQGKQRMGPEDLILYSADMAIGLVGDLAQPYPWDYQNPEPSRRQQRRRDD